MRRRPALAAVVAAGLVACAVLAVLAARWASDDPDGLERVALDRGFADAARDHALGGLPTAGYALDGLGDGPLGTAAAGVLGVLVTFGAARAVLALARSRRRTG